MYGRCLTTPGDGSARLNLGPPKVQGVETTCGPEGCLCERGGMTLRIRCHFGHKPLSFRCLIPSSPLPSKPTHHPKEGKE